MIRLSIPTEPYWISLGADIRFRVRPPTTSLMETARATVRRSLDDLRKAHQLLIDTGATITGMADLSDPAVVDGEFASLLAKTLARYAIVEWEGVHMADGSPALVCAATIDLAMTIDALARSFVGVYMTSLEGLVTEGNASALAPNGSLAAGANTAPDAGQPIGRTVN